MHTSQPASAWDTMSCDRPGSLGSAPMRSTMDGVDAPPWRVAADPLPRPDIGFWAILREDLAAQSGDWSRPGFRAIAMYRFGVASRDASPPLRKLGGLLYRAMHRFVRNHYGIELHASAQIGRRVKIAHQGAIVIHENAVIGDDCVIRQGVTIGAAAERSKDLAPRLGRKVDIGAGAVLIGRIVIGDNVRIGPNAVVMMNVAADAVVVAAPSRVLQADAPGAVS